MNTLHRLELEARIRRAHEEVRRLPPSVWAALEAHWAKTTALVALVAFRVHVVGPVRQPRLVGNRNSGHDPPRPRIAVMAFGRPSHAPPSPRATSTGGGTGAALERTAMS